MRRLRRASSELAPSLHQRGDARGAHERIRTILSVPHAEATLATAFIATSRGRRPRSRHDGTEAPNEPERSRAVAGRQSAGMGFAEVRALGDHEIALLVRYRKRVRRVQAVREIREERGIAGDGSVSLALPLELSLRVLPDGLQHPVPVSPAMPTRCRIRLLSRSDSSESRSASATTSAAANVQLPAKTETSQHSSLVVVEEVVRPGDRRFERALSLLDVSVPRSQEPDLSPSRSWIAGVESARTRAAASSIASRKLIDCVADRIHVLVRLKAWADSRGTFDEERAHR